MPLFRFLADDLRRILPCGYDDPVSPQWRNLFRDFIGEHAGDHIRAERFCHGNAHAGQPAGPGREKEGFPGAIAALAEQIQIAGGIRLGQAGGLRKGQLSRDGHHHAFVHRHGLGIPATAQQGAHPVTLAPFGHRRARFAHNAGHLQPHPRRAALRGRIFPLPLQQIRAVKRRGVNFDAHVMRAYHRLRYVRPDEILIFINQHGFHLLLFSFAPDWVLSTTTSPSVPSSASEMRRLERAMGCASGRMIEPPGTSRQAEKSSWAS